MLTLPCSVLVASTVAFLFLELLTGVIRITHAFCSILYTAQTAILAL